MDPDGPQAKVAPGERCGAKCKNGQPCTQWPVAGNTRCKLHGGLSPSGPNHPRYKHGLYSKALPKELRKTYDRIMSDPDMLSAKGEVGLLKARLEELVGRVGTNASAANWRTLQVTFREFRTCNASGDGPGMVAALNRMQQLIDGAVNHDEAWEGLVEMIDRATQVASREWRRLAENKAVATVEQVRLIVTSIAEAVLLHVTDQRARLAVAEHINRLCVIDRISPVQLAGGDQPGS